MSQLRNCPQCGQVFSYVNKNLCHRCIEAEEKEFKLVKTYIRENDGATISETADATGIEEEKILRFLREGRLLSRGLQSSVLLQCKRCGEKISEGSYCRDCKQELDREIKQSLSDLRPTQDNSTRHGDRIRIMDSNKKNI